MALVKTNIGTRPDGSPLFHYSSDGHVVLTGPISGDVTLGDGTTYDVTEPVIEVESDAHAAEVAHLLGQRYAAEGHPDHTDGEPFIYTPQEN